MTTSEEALPLSPPDLSEPAPRVRSYMKVMVFSLIANLGLYSFAIAVPGYLIPATIQRIVGTGVTESAASLSIVTVIGAIAAMLTQPIAGAISDRTRTRFGRRAPFMLGGVIVAGLALIVLGTASSIAVLALVWAVVQIGYSFAQSSFAAVLPDRIPPEIRGTFATFTGLGLALGATAGALVGAVFITRVAAGFTTFAGLMIVAVVLFLVVNPDRSTAPVERSPLSWRTLASSYWISPRQHPDFAWAFTGRLLLSLAYFMVNGYQLFILQNYIGLGSAAAAAPVAAMLALISIGATLVAGSIAGPISDRFKRRKVPAIIAGCIYVAGLVAPLVSPTVPGMIVFTALFGFGFGAYQAVDTALMSEVLPSSEDHGRALGVLNVAVSIPQAAGAAFAGVQVVLTGGYLVLFPVGIVIALVGAFSVIRIKSVR